MELARILSLAPSFESGWRPLESRITVSASRAKPMLSSTQLSFPCTQSNAPRTPVCALSDRHRIDSCKHVNSHPTRRQQTLTLVHSADALSSVDIHEHGKCAWRLATALRQSLSAASPNERHTFTPFSSCFVLVMSAVFMHVQNPIDPCYAVLRPHEQVGQLRNPT
jgi:hypothetical protein